MNSAATQYNVQQFQWLRRVIVWLNFMNKVMKYKLINKIQWNSIYMWVLIWMKLKQRIFFSINERIRFFDRHTHAHKNHSEILCLLLIIIISLWDHLMPIGVRSVACRLLYSSCNISWAHFVFTLEWNLIWSQCFDKWNMKAETTAMNIFAHHILFTIIWHLNIRWL